MTDSRDKEHPGRKVLLLTDIEGSSGCYDRAGSLLGTREWACACRELTRDTDAVVKAFFEAGATHVRVQDFHRTGFNIFRHSLDRRAVLRQGYKAGPVPGIGCPPPVDTLAMIGFHAASGTGGFLPHTLTSRFAHVYINGRILCEAELFAGALNAPSRQHLRTRLFSGCPVACKQAATALPGIQTYEIPKLRSGLTPEENPSAAEVWRAGLARAARASLESPGAELPSWNGPFRIEVEMRDGETAAKTAARRWNLDHSGKTVMFTVLNRLDLFRRLSDIAYMQPWMKPAVQLLLRLADMRGRRALSWAANDG